MKFSSFGESLLKIATINKSEEEIKFRKSVDDLNMKLAFNRKNKTDEKTDSSKNHSKNKPIIPSLSLHDKVVNLIKFNKSKTKKNHLQYNEKNFNQEKGIFLNQEKGNKKLIKQLMDIKTKFSKKTEESRFNSTYFTTKNSLRKVNFKEKKTEKDNIDKILLDSQNIFSHFEGEIISLNSRKFNNFSIDPNLWTSRSENL